MTKFSEFACCALVVIGLALIFLGMLVSSGTIVPNLVLALGGFGLYQIGVWLGGKIDEKKRNAPILLGTPQVKKDERRKVESIYNNIVSHISVFVKRKGE